MRENVKLDKLEAYFYEVQHPEIYNLKEQNRLRAILSSCLSDLPTNALCIDIGSGTGNLSAHLKKLEKEVVACDLSKDMLKQNKGATYRVVCDASNLPIKDDISNFTSTYSFFHHIPNYVKVVDEICRITRKKQSKLYFDHDNFMCEPLCDGSKLDDKRRLFSFLLWASTHPQALRKFCEYMFYGRHRHKTCIKNVNFILTDHNAFSPKQIAEILITNSFHTQIIKHKTGSFLIAKRS